MIDYVWNRDLLFVHTCWDSIDDIRIFHILFLISDKYRLSSQFPSSRDLINDILLTIIILDVTMPLTAKWISKNEMKSLKVHIISNIK